MAETTDSVVESVEHFLTAARRRLRIEAAYLYGSQVASAATRWSDIDLAVISPDFSDNLFQERLALMQLAAQIGDRRPVRGAGACRDRAGHGEPHAGGERSRARARIIVDYLIGQGLVRKPAQVAPGSGDGGGG